MKNKSIALVPAGLILAAFVATIFVILAGCSTTPAPAQKQLAAVWVVTPNGDFGQYVTNNESRLALEQSFTKVLLAKGYTVCPLVADSGCQITNYAPEALDQDAIKLGKDSMVEYLFEAVLNQATVGDSDRRIHVNIVSKMLKLGNEYAPNEIIATHEWPQDGSTKMVSGDSQAVIEVIQRAAEETAEEYPAAADLSPGAKSR